MSRWRIRIDIDARQALDSIDDEEVRLLLHRAIRALPDEGAGDVMDLRELKGYKRWKPPAGPMENWRLIFEESRRRREIVVWRVALRPVAYEPMPRRAPRT